MKHIRWNMLPIIGIGLLLFGGCPNPADPDDPGEPAGNTVHFIALSANGSETATTSRLTLTFDQDISGLSAEDILLNANETGVVKGSLTRTGTGTYALEIQGITSTGTISVSASKAGYTITGNPKQVTIFQYTPPADIAVAFTALSADGSETATTSSVTLTFDRDISGLSAEDILLEPGNTGAAKGALTRTGTGTYTLEIQGITSTGTISVSASKTGYTITGNPKQVTVFQYTPPVSIPVAFTALSADGSETATTRSVTLTFDQDISGLSAEDILLEAKETGAVKGSLTRTGTGVYSLAVSGITNTGEIEMQVSKAGYVISPASRTVTVHYRYTYSAIIQVALQSDWELLDQTQSIGKNTVTVFSSNGDYGSYQWYLDGAPVGTGSSYTYDSQSAQAGDIYEIALVAGDGAGETRSGRCRITITD